MKATWLTLSSAILLGLGGLHAQVVLFSETFDAQIPPAWTTADVDGNTAHIFYASQGMFVDAWEHHDLLGNFGAAAYSISLYQPPGQADDWLMSPAITIGANARVSFEVIQDVLQDTLEVLVATSLAGSVPQPSDFTSTVYRGSGFPGVWLSTPAIDLSGFSGQVWLAVRNVTDMGGLIGIRNFEVVEIVPDDGRVVGIVRPEQRGCAYSGSEQLWIEFLNAGSTDIGALTFCYSINESAPLCETVLLFVAIPPGTGGTFPFFPPVDLSNGYVHEITVWSDITGDTNASNDTARTNLYSFTPHDLNTSAYCVAFEDSLPSDSSTFAWTFEDPDTNGQTAHISDLSARSGSHSILMEGGGDWAFSPCLDLVANESYKLRFYALERFQAAQPDILEIWLSDANRSADTVLRILPPAWVIDTSGNFEEWVVDFVAPASGPHHIAIRLNIGHGVFIDDLKVTHTAVSTCPTPTGLQTTIFGSSSVLLSWTPVANANSYRIRGRAVGQPTFVSLLADSSSHQVHGLNRNTTYEWQVAAICSGTTSLFSPFQTFTIADSFDCDAPASTITTAITSSTALLVWGAVPEADQYRLVGREVGSPSVVMITLPGLSNNYQVSGLSSGTTYEWAIRSICQEGGLVVSSGLSPVSTFATLSPAVKGSDSARLFPNPTDGVVYLGREVEKVRVFDSLGKEVTASTAVDARAGTLDLGNLSSGMYYVQFSAAEQGRMIPVLLR